MDAAKHNEKLLTAALGYASRGWRVHPLRPGTKVPALNDWPTAATADAETIATWWTGEFRGFNVGIATGKASNLWVLDIDTGHGPDAARSLKTLEAAHKPLKATYTVRTPSGGLHLYYAWPDEVPDADGELPTWRNTNVLGAGIDVRAEGGQVAAWPSVLRDGGRYKRQSTAGPVRVPRWLASLTVARPPQATELTLSVADLTPAASTLAASYGARAVSGVVDDLKALSAAATGDGRGYSGPPWNNTVYTKARRLLELAHADWAPIGEADAFALLMEHAPRDAGFTSRTVEAIWASAHKASGDAVAKLPGTIVGPYMLPGPSRPGGAEGAPGSDEFFTKAEGLLADKVADWIATGDIALGRDRSLWVYEGGVWRPDPDVVVRRGGRLLKARWRHAFAATIEDLVLDSPNLYRLTDSVNHDVVNVRNGMLDWASGVLRPHDASYLSTVQLPVEWDPEAVCPRFDRWVGEVVPDGVAQRLWEVIGYMVTPGNRMQRAVLLYGPGGNGKGTLIRVLKHLIGSWNTSSVTLRAMTEGKFEVAELYGKQANLAGDIEARYLRETAMFKSLTGQDSVQAQRKHQRPFEFTCHATPLFSANELWRSSDNSQGYHRRWLHLPMDRLVGGAEPFDEDALLAELPGILVKAVQAIRPVVQRGSFTESAETIWMSSEFRQQSDLVEIWRRNDDAIVYDEPGSTSGQTWRKRDEVYNRFKSWAVESGHGTMSSTKFYQHLDRIGYVASRRSEGRGYYGLVLSSTPGGMMPFSGSLRGEVDG